MLDNEFWYVYIDYDGADNRRQIKVSTFESARNIFLNIISVYNTSSFVDICLTPFERSDTEVVDITN